MNKRLSSPFFLVLALAMVLIMAFIFISPLASATTYYVSPTGMAPWSKCTTIKTPCSVNTAMKHAKAGDTVNFLNGTYSVATSGNYEYPAIRPFNSGVKGKPITFKATPGTVRIKASNPNSADSPLIGSYGRNWIVWDGFILDTSDYPSSIGRGPVWFEGANYCTIRNSEVIGHYWSVNDNFDGIRGGASSYLTIANNKIHGFTNGVDAAGIRFFKVSHAVIQNNEIYGNSCGFHDKEGAQHNTYRYNFIHDNKNGNSYTLWIMTQNGNNIDDIQIYQNIFANNPGGINVDADAPMTITNVNWYNNVFYNAGGASLGNTSTTSAKIGSAWNNIIALSSGKVFLTRGHSNPNYVDYNNYYGSSQTWILHAYQGEQAYSSLSGWQRTGNDVHSISTNPHFVNASGNYSHATDFKRISYPADGRGGSYASVMGAYITGNEIIGYSGSSPSASRNDPDPPSAVPGKSLSNECADWQTRHPEWIFCDDFEDDTPLVRPGRYIEYGEASGRFILADKVGYKGSKGMKAVWNKWDVGAGGLKLAFGRNPGSGMTNGIAITRDFREVYYRMYMKLQSGWKGNPQKLSRATVISGPDWSQAMIAHLWGDNSTHLSIDPASCVVRGKVRCRGYNDFGHLFWIGQEGGETAIFNGKHNDQWYCIEAHVKLNDPGKSNGVQEFRINGKLEAGNSKLDFVGDYTDYGINAIFFENYWNSGAWKQEERYFDNIVVSTKPIGCLD